MKRYVTFGQDHRHLINGEVFDKDCVAIVNGDRDKVFEIFGQKFSFEYPEEYWDDRSMSYFHRGYIEVREDSEEDVNCINIYKRLERIASIEQGCFIGDRGSMHEVAFDALVELAGKDARIKALEKDIESYKGIKK